MPGKRQIRPSSDDVIDLHVFVVPLELWIGKYRTAYNNAVLQATSAGFIRIPAEHTLTKARLAIEEQLGTNVIPEEFVFLRSVGRCLAAVNQTQEDRLKSKHFTPPVAFSPELFLLPCSHSDLASILARDANDVYLAGQTVEEPSLLDGDYDSSFTSPPGYAGTRDLSDESSRTEDSANTSQRDQGDDRTVDDSDSFLKRDHASSLREAEYEDLLKQHPIDQSEMLKKVPKPYKKVSTMSDKLKGVGSQERSQSCLPAIQVIHPEKPLVVAGDSKRVGVPTPLPSGRVISNPRKQDGKGGHSRNISRASAFDDGNDDDGYFLQEGNENFDLLARHDKGGDEHSPGRAATESEEQTSPISASNGREWVDQDVEDAEHSKSDNSDGTQLNGDSLSPRDDLDYDSELLISPREQAKSNRSNRRLKMELEKKRLEEKKRHAAEGANKMMQEMDELIRKKKIEEDKRRKQEEEVKKMMEVAKEEKKIEIDRLREEVKVAREEKIEVQRRRETIVKLAKELQSKVHSKTGKDIEMWKKKYHSELERTTELEEELTRLRTDLDIQHKKLLGTFDSKAVAVKTQKVTKVNKAPSQLSNQKIQLQRLQQEVESLKQRVDETRVKLSAERKMRAIAFQELKELRNQALEKKINAALSNRRFPGLRPLNGNVTA